MQKDQGRKKAHSGNVKQIKDNDDKSIFYTGLPWDIFIKTYTHLEPFMGDMNRESLPFIDQLFLTLVRLRLDLPFRFLAYSTGVSKTTIADYFWKVVDVGNARPNFIAKLPELVR